MTFDAGVQTANTLLLQLGDFVLEFGNQSGIQVTGSTSVTWGDFVSGTAWYYWQEDGSQSQVTGTYCLNTGTRSQVLFSSDKINCVIVGGGESAQYPAISPSLNDIYLSCGTGNTISVTGIVPYSYTGGIGIKGFASPTYNANTTALNYNSTFVNASVAGTNVRNISTYYPSSPYVPDLRGDLSYNDAVPIVLDWVNDNLDDGVTPLTPDDVLQWEDIAPTEEPTESPTELDGNIIINNYDSATLNFSNTIAGNADIDLNGSVDIDVNAAAGAFGAGAVVVSGEVDASLTNNGDFILNADGTLDIAEISLNGDTVQYNQNYTVDSGGTVVNNNITGNYYESGVIVELPTLDYNEILSEREFYNILETETYYIPEMATDQFFALEAVTVPAVPALPEQITTLSGLTVDRASGFLDDVGLSTVYTPLAIVTIVCFILRGGK